MSMYPGGGYPPPPPPPYANAAYGPYTAAPRNGMGTTALVLGIVGLLTSWSVVGGLLFGLGAVACGVIGRNRVKEGLADNAVVAGAGIALGALATVLAVAFVFVVIGFYRQVGFSDYTDCMTRAGQDQNAQSTCVQDFRSRIEKEFGVKVEG